MPSRLASSALPVLGLLLIPHLHAQEVPAAVTVIIPGASGRGPELFLVVRSLAGAGARSVPFDTQGRAVHTNLPAAGYRLSIQRGGLTVWHETVNLIPGANLALTAALAVNPVPESVTVVSATPLAGLDRSRDQIPGPVRTASDADIHASGALDLSDFLNRRIQGVFVNEIQGNPLQPDVNYRGYTASPLLGTPQGISIFIDGVRQNQPFGDSVGWDLIPRAAISEMALVPGSNPSLASIRWAGRFPFAPRAV